MKKLLAVLLLAACLLSLAGCKNGPKEVARLIYNIGAFNNIPCRSRIVDPEAGKIWYFDPQQDPDTGDYIERDPEAENEGYTLLCDLTPEELAEIRSHCKLEDLLEEYETLATDGLWWNLTIIYADGTEQRSSSAMHWPKELEELADFLLELTGFDVLPYHKLT